MTSGTKYSDDVKAQLLTLRRIQAHADNHRHPHMGDDPMLAWFIAQCGEFAEIAQRNCRAANKDKT